MTPEQLAKSDTEHAHQCALFAAINQFIWDLEFGSDKKPHPLADKLRWLHAIPNGGERHGAVAGKMKAEGVKSGIYDLFLPVPRVTDRLYTFQTLFAGAYGVLHGNFTYEAYHGLYIEMKAPSRCNNKDGGLNDNQIKFKEFIGVQGYGHCICYTWKEAYDAVMKYLGVET